MEKRNTLTDKILNKLPLNENEVIIAPIIGDGNCLYRSLAQFLTNDQNNHKIIKEIIHHAAPENKEQTKPFFPRDVSDNILAESKLDNYIDKIKNNGFYAGIIEISLAAIIFNYTIVVYSIEEEQNSAIKKESVNKDKNSDKIETDRKINNLPDENKCKDIINNNNIIYKHLSTIETNQKLNNNQDDIIVLLYDHNIYHYSLIVTDQTDTFNDNQILKNEGKNIINLEKIEVVRYVKEKSLPGIKLNIFEGEFAEDLNTTKFTKKKGFDSYYEDIYNYILSKEKAFDNETKKINWNKVKYPANCYGLYLSNKQKAKKRELFRNRAEKFIIINHNLYKKDKNYEKNNIKYQIPLEVEKIHLIKSIHINNGHIGCNRTVAKIIDEGFKWDNMLGDVLSYIKYDCTQYINQKAGEKIDAKSKIIITKGPKERFIIDGFQLDQITAEITGFSYVIEIIDHFSKFLKSYAVKENNSKSALLCIKDYCNYIGYPKLIQTDNGLEYKNSVIKEFCESNKIVHIFSSPRHPQTNGCVEIAHKETRKYILNVLSENDKELDLNNILLDANYIHNYNVHTVTKYRPIDLINNTDINIYNEVIANINKKYKAKSNKEFKTFEKGIRLRLKPGCYKIGRNIKFRKAKSKYISIPATVEKDYDCGLLLINIDANIYEFKLNEKYFIDSSLVVMLIEKQWKTIVNICNKHSNDEEKEETKEKKKDNKTAKNPFKKNIYPKRKNY